MATQVTLNSGSVDSAGSLALKTNGTTTAVTIGTNQVATFAQAPVLPAASIPQSALAANVAGNGPAFSAYRTGGNQSLTTATYTKIQLNTEEYDTNSNFDSSTNYRFTPTVAGYYQISGSVGLTGTNITRILCAIYKNGSEYFRGQDASANLSQVTVSGLVYFNGSTDYIELYVFATFVGTSDISSGQKYNYFTGCLVRSA